MFNIFPYVFQTTFNTLMNSDFIDSIIDSVLNNETVNNMINEIENMASLDINLSEREKEYIISGPENEEIKDFYVGNVDPYSIKAVFKDNLLTVHVPKKNKIDDKVTIINVDYTVK